jgi:hypothetical protein
MMDGLLFDSEEDLNDAYQKEKKREESLKKPQEESKN